MGDDWIKTREWVTVSTRTRNIYSKLKKKNITDPHDEVFSQDPQENNPLAQVDKNPWTKYFEDSDVRDLIIKDVDRTFPEIEFFQQDSVRKMMCDILLVYSKENPFVSYKQGMHEILAPLLFVLYSDEKAFEHALEDVTRRKSNVSFGMQTDILKHIYDSNFLEHDAYMNYEFSTMFSELMLEVSRWYEETNERAPTPNRTRNTSGTTTSMTPYMRVQDNEASSQLMQDLAAVGERLATLDPPLHAHLANLDIPPQLYGIRWVRLLFGRELPLQDVLFLWDVLLVERPLVVIVEAVSLAMLVQIRQLLLNSDYGGCLQYLMRYPPIVDVSSFVQLARHFRHPKKVPRPSASGTNNFTGITVAGKAHPNRIHRRDMVLGYEEPPSARFSSNSMLTKMKNTLKDKPESALFKEIDFFELLGSFLSSQFGIITVVINFVWQEYIQTLLKKYIRLFELGNNGHGTTLLRSSTPNTPLVGRANKNITQRHDLHNSHRQQDVCFSIWEGDYTQGTSSSPFSLNHPPCTMQKVSMLESQVVCLQSRLVDRDILCAEISHILDCLSTEIVSATQHDTRVRISSDLAALSQRLTAQGSTTDDNEGGFLSIKSVELATEARVRTRKKENEMTTLSH